MKGSINVGTWVRPRFSLLPYAARRIRLRFLGTSIELGAEPDLGLRSSDVTTSVQDDGWYVDDIHIVGALGGTPFTITQDTRVITRAHDVRRQLLRRSPRTWWRRRRRPRARGR